MAYQHKSLQPVTEATRAGKPLKFKSNLQLQTLIDAYFIYCKATKQIPTITGLALALDTNRMTLINYGNNQDYFYTIQKAKLRIEEASLQLGLQNKTNPALSIFNLKNNFGWTDKVEIQSTNLNLEATVNDDLISDFGNYLKAKTD